MTSHKDFMDILVAAAQRGEDPIPILRGAQEHVASCEQCRRALGRWIRDALTGEELILLAMRRLDETGQLEKPPPYPPIDYSFLDLDDPAPFSSRGAAPVFWRLASEPQAHSHPDRPVYEWVGPQLTVNVDRRRRKAMFRDLPPLLLSSLSVPAEPLIVTRKRGVAAPMQGQMLTLRDEDRDIAVAVTVQSIVKGKSDIGIKVETAGPVASPKPAIVTLRSSRGGADKAVTKEGKVSFASNPPDTYTIAIELTEGEEKGQTWRLQLTLEAE